MNLFFFFDGFSQFVDLFLELVLYSTYLLVSFPHFFDLALLLSHFGFLSFYLGLEGLYLTGIFGNGVFFNLDGGLCCCQLSF